MTQQVIRYLPEDQLIQRALEALMNELGPMETTRFLSLAQEERVESVLRHREWQNSLDKNAFFEQVFGQNATTDNQ
ncbi:MAG: hypothetical protein KC443_15700 [Anaerolineales bacterium]|nr:hypothetical protein [Anaerolineales bacterium]MCB8965536.1 hypothetical protein [Ardenticatenaceae bacterium]